MGNWNLAGLYGGRRKDALADGAYRAHHVCGRWLVVWPFTATDRLAAGARDSCGLVDRGDTGAALCAAGPLWGKPLDRPFTEHHRRGDATGAGAGDYRWLRLPDLALGRSNSVAICPAPALCGVDDAAFSPNHPLLLHA